MAKRTKKSTDPNRRAFQVVQEATEEPKGAEKARNGKNPAAVALGRLGGRKGGPARAKKLSGELKKEIARKAAAARWKKKRDTEGTEK